MLQAPCPRCTGSNRAEQPGSATGSPAHAADDRVMDKEMDMERPAGAACNVLARTAPRRGMQPQKHSCAASHTNQGVAQRLAATLQQYTIELLFHNVTPLKLRVHTCHRYSSMTSSCPVWAARSSPFRSSG